MIKADHRGPSFADLKVPLITAVIELELVVFSHGGIDAPARRPRRHLCPGRRTSGHRSGTHRAWRADGALPLR
jgi:hypothetical protein